MMPKVFKDLFECDGWDEMTETLQQACNVTMLADFGPLKKGDYYAHLAFEFDKGMCTAWSDATTEVHAFAFKLAAA